MRHRRDGCRSLPVRGRRRAGAAALTLLLVPLLVVGCGAEPQPPYFDLVEALPAASFWAESRRLELGSEESRPFLVSGWQHADDYVGLSFATAVARRAELEILVLQPRDLELQLRARAVGEAVERRVRVGVNGEVVGEIVLASGFESHPVSVPGAVLRVGRNRIILEHLGGAEPGPVVAEPIPLSVWDSLQIDAARRSPARPRVRDGVLTMGQGTRLDYLVPLRPASLLRLETIDLAPSVPLHVGVVLEDPAEERLIPVRAGDAITIPVAVSRPQLALVSLMVGGAETSRAGARLGGVALVREAGAKPVPAPSAEPCTGCNLLLISIDTLRADHLGPYGYESRVPLSAGLERLRADSVLFRRAYAPAPSTLPSHASLLTGLNVGRHGASRTRSLPLAERALTLAEILADAGASTAAITSGAQVDPVWALDQGFETYTSRQGAATWRTPFSRTVDEAVAWLAAHPERFFLFLHTYEVHTPYAPAAEDLARLDPEYSGDLPATIHPALLRRVNAGERRLQEEDIERVIAAYDAEILSMDRALGRLLDSLQEDGRYDDTLIVFTSDHGEELGEHGALGWHSHTLYDELLHVPLIMKYPQGRDGGSVRSRLTRLVDVVPTVLDVLDPRRHLTGLDGVSAHATGTGLRARVVFSEREWPRRQDRMASVRSLRWKLVLDRSIATGASEPGVRLFDLAADPGELEDVGSRHPHLAAALRRLLDTELSRPPIGSPEEVVVPERLARQLRALGYVE